MHCISNEVITAIPGIGDTLGVIILSKIGDINRFDALCKLVAFAGSDVKVTQSDEFTVTKQHISNAARLTSGGQFGLPSTEQHFVI